MRYKSPPNWPNQVIVKETKNWFLTIWENQYYLGRGSIEHKSKKRGHLHELSDNELQELFSIVSGYEKALMRTFNATHFNWTCLMNNSYKPKNIDKSEPFHLHVWPRYKDIVNFNGEMFEDEVFGHHYDKTKEKYVDKDFLVQIADKLMENWG